MLARDLMQRNVKTVSPDATVREVAEILAQEDYTGLPVVDEEGRLVGIVTEADLLVRAKTLKLPTVFPFLGGVIFLESPRKDRKSTRLNSSHVKISYAVFCLKKKMTGIANAGGGSQSLHTRRTV